MANEIPQMSLKQATLNQGSFTPIVYTPQVEDMTILQKSLAQREARQESASEKQTAVDVALAQVEDKLNPNEKEWFANYKGDIQQQIQEQIDLGDYGSAIRTANRMAGKAASDSQILDRIKANEVYQQAKKEVIARNDISQDTKDWWLDTHQYSYTDKYDADGNVIGGEYSQFEDRPAAPVDMNALAEKAIRFAAPEKDIHSSDSTVTRGNTVYEKDSKGNYVAKESNPNNLTDPRANITTSKGQSVSRTWLTEEKLKEVMNAVFAGTNGAKEAVIQDRKVALWKLRKLKQQYDTSTDEEERNSLLSSSKLYENDLYDKGILMSEDEYIAKKVSPILHNAAYDWKEYHTSSNDSFVNGDNGSRGGSSMAGIEGLPKGFGVPLRLEGAGVVEMEWGSYGNNVKERAYNAAESSKQILMP